VKETSSFNCSFAFDTDVEKLREVLGIPQKPAPMLFCSIDLAGGYEDIYEAPAMFYSMAETGDYLTIYGTVDGSTVDGRLRYRFKRRPTISSQGQNPILLMFGGG